MWIRFGSDRSEHGPLVVFFGVWHQGLGGRSSEFSLGLAPHEHVNYRVNGDIGMVVECGSLFSHLNQTFFRES